MSEGRLGAVVPAATTNTTVYTVPAGKVATVNINLLNRGVADATVRLAIAAADTPTAAEYIEFGYVLTGNGGVLERRAIILSEGERVVVHSSTGDCSVRVHGFEAPATT